MAAVVRLWLLETEQAIDAYRRGVGLALASGRSTLELRATLARLEHRHAVLSTSVPDRNRLADVADP